MSVVSVNDGPMAGGERTATRSPDFALHVLQLASGGAVTQLLAFALAPIIARLYAPETFGAAATFAAVLTILTSIVTLRYELAMLLPERDREAAAIGWGALLAVMVFCGALAALAFVANGHGVLGGLIPHRELLPAALLLGGVTLVLVHWGMRQRQFSLLATSRVASASVAEAGRLAFGLLGRDFASSLIVSNMVGVGVGILVLVQGMRRTLGAFLGIRPGEAARGLRQYYKFPLYASWIAVLNTLSHQVTPLVLGVFFTAQVVGHYSQAQRIAATALLMLSSAITQVFSQSAARARHEGGLSELAESATRNTLRLAWYPAAALLCLGPELMAWFLGAPWREAGRYAQILSVWLLATFVSEPLSALYSVLERQELGLAMNVALLAVRIGGLVAGGLLGSPLLALALFAAGGALLNLAQIAVLLRLARGHAGPALRTALLCLVFSLPLVSLTLLRPLLGAAPHVAVYLAVVGGLCYGALWLAADRPLRVMAWRLVRNVRLPRLRHRGRRGL